MAKETKKKRNGVYAAASRQSSEKLDAAMRRFDQTVLFFVVVVIVCVMIGRGGDYDLTRGNSYGFAQWFLLIPAYPVLEMVNFVNWLTGNSWDPGGMEVEFFGLCNLSLAAGFWLWMRWRGKGRGAAFVRMMRVFTMILLFWGVVQIICCATAWLWCNGALSSFHRHQKIENTLKK